MSSITLRHAIILALAPTTTLSTVAIANTTATTSTVPTVNLDPVVVTATRTPTKVTNTIAQTTVIDGEALQRYQGQNALDIIKAQSGFSSYSSGGTDKTSNFYLRGFDSSGILVLIDGIRYGSLTTGQSALGALSASQIGRIEILHGASGSSIYGASAMGGVIQIFTKKGIENGFHAFATVGAGSHDKLTYGAGVSYANDNTNLSLTASHTETDGINAIVSPYAASQRDTDGFDRNSISASISHKINQVEVGASLLASKGTVEYDNTFSTAENIYDKQKNGSANAYINYNYHPNGQIRLQYGESIDKSSNFANTRNTGIFDSTQKQTNLSLVHALPVGKILVGGEHLQQDVDSSTKYSQTSRRNTGAYVGYQANYNNFDAQAFVRYDDNSWYGDKTTYNAGLAYRLTPAVRVGVNYATGFKAPSFNQLYWPGSGNPNLKPENSKNTEAFVELAGANHKTRLTGYYSDVTDLIGGWPAKNFNEVEVMGANLTTDWAFNNGYIAGLSYDYQEANDVTPTATNPKTKSNLTVRPEHKGTAYIGYVGNNFNLRAEYQRLGSYYMQANHGAKIEGYGLLNLSGTYELSPNISITQRLNNVLNKKYIANESWGTRYNEDGINFYTAVTLKY